jgi:hypothetical protein
MVKRARVLRRIFFLSFFARNASTYNSTHPRRVRCFSAADSAAGPSIAFLIRLSFASEGAAVTPVFWESNFLTLRGGQVARLCFVAGACVAQAMSIAALLLATFVVD